MVRIRCSVNTKKKRRTVLERISDYRGQRPRIYRRTKKQVTHPFVYFYRDRKAKRGDSHRLWIQHISAASRAQGLTYGHLTQDLSPAGVGVDRRILTELTVGDINVSGTLVKVTKDALPADISAPKARQVSSSAKRLTILDNPCADRVRRMSGLIGHSARSHSGLMLVKGSQTMREFTAHRPGVVHDVYVREGTWETHADAVDVARCATHWIHLMTAEVPATPSGNSQDICIVASLGALPCELLEPSVGEMIVVFARGRDPGNVGTIIRTTDVFGVVGIVVIAGAVNAASPEITCSGVGSVPHTPMCVVPPFVDTRALIHGRSATLLGTDDGTASTSLSNLPVQGISAHSYLSQSHAWVFGNEARSPSGDKMRPCDGLVSIPMTGDTESLSMVSAAATCLSASRTVRGVES